jgi:hypothetical protein
MVDTNGNTSALTRSHGTNLSIVSMGSTGKHQMSRKAKGMLALGGKKAGKGKGLLSGYIVNRIIRKFLVDTKYSKDIFRRVKPGEFLR